MKKADAVCWMLDAASCMLNVESWMLTKGNKVGFLRSFAVVVAKL